jgi:hypothetical protein
LGEVHEEEVLSFFLTPSSSVNASCLLSFKRRRAGENEKGKRGHENPYLTRI